MFQNHTLENISKFLEAGFTVRVHDTFITQYGGLKTFTDAVAVGVSKDGRKIKIGGGYYTPMIERLNVVVSR